MTSFIPRSVTRMAALAVLVSLANLAFAQDDVKKEESNIPEFKAPPLKPVTEKLPAAFYKKTPESIEELKLIQDHVATIVEKVMPAVVSVRVGQASGSGVIVSRDGYILTAGHVSGKPDRDVVVYLHNGEIAKGKTLGGNSGIDTGMIKIVNAKEDLPFVEMGDSSALKPGHWCMVIAHHGGFKTGRTPPVRLGRVLNNDEKRATLTTDAVLVGGDSGGPLFDMYGRVVGINSRISTSLAQNMHVNVNPFRDNWDKLAKGEVWGGKLGGGGFGGGKGGVYLGVTTEARDDKLVVTAIAPNSPAEKAGFKVEDVIVKFDDKDVSGPLALYNFVQAHKAGDQVMIEIRRGDEILRMRVEIGKRT